MQFTMPGTVSRHAGTWRFIGFPDFGYGIVEHAGREHSTFSFLRYPRDPFLIVIILLLRISPSEDVHG